ncbi:hypothetical protein JCM10213_008385 [Rhodosporidiobolus nylandii]
MPAPQAAFVASGKNGFDPSTLSDNEDDGASLASRSTWASESDATILGLVDGLMPEQETLDWKVSRVGGLPSFPLPSPPPQSAATCKSCSRPMPLLSQLYVPLPDSALERVVYIFACPRPSCRKREGAVRAFRANALWVEGAEEQRKKQEEEERREKEKQERAERAKNFDLGGMIFGGRGASSNKAASSSATGNTASAALNPFAPPSAAASSSNPFSLPSSAASPAANPFAPAPASNPFSAPSPSTTSEPAPQPPPVSSASPSSDPLPSTSTSSWPPSPPQPSYPAQYINTMYEPASPSSSSTSLAKHLAATKLVDPASDDPDLSDDERPAGHREGKGAGGRVKKGAPAKAGDARKGKGVAGGNEGGAAGWQGEGYEVQKVKGVDEVFLKFQEKTQREGRQVLRYEYNTQPLAFSATSAAYRTLFPPPSSGSHPMATAAASSAPADAIGVYTPSRAPSCAHCGAPSRFEYQLMPHLVSVLNSSGLSRPPGAEEGTEKGKVNGEEGLDFATVWVFACERECASSEGEAWREEGVWVEWEEE